MKLLASAAFAATLLVSSHASAVLVNWADLTAQTTNQVTGTITVGSDNIGVTYSGPYDFAQTSGGGTNYWTEGTPAPYTGGIVDNAPPTTDIIALGTGGPKIITFSETVSDVYLALVSWNGNAGVFDQPFEVISQGCGFWGCGTFTAVTPVSFVGTGELHGVIRFTGAFDSVSFTDLNESWHGIQIGIAGLAPVVVRPPPVGGVPEPGVLALMVAGLGLLGWSRRRVVPTA